MPQGPFPPPQLPELPPGRNPSAAIVGHPLTEGRIEATPIYDRARLRAGDHIDGPAIITQLDATTCCSSARPSKSLRLAASSCTTDLRFDRS